MSDIQFNCPKCGHNLVVDAAGAGMSVPCPECSEPLIIPGPEEQTSAQVDNASAGVDTVSAVDTATSEPLLDRPMVGGQAPQRKSAVRRVARVFRVLFVWLAMAACLIGWLVSVAARWIVVLPMLKARLVRQYKKAGAQAYRNKIDEEKGAAFREQINVLDHEAEVAGASPTGGDKSKSRLSLLLARVSRRRRMKLLLTTLGKELVEGEAVSDSLSRHIRRATKTKEIIERIRSTRLKIAAAKNFVIGIALVGTAVAAYYYRGDIAGLSFGSSAAVYEATQGSGLAIPEASQAISDMTLVESPPIVNTHAKIEYSDSDILSGGELERIKRSVGEYAGFSVIQRADFDAFPSLRMYGENIWEIRFQLIEDHAFLDTFNESFERPGWAEMWIRERIRIPVEDTKGFRRNVVVYETSPDEDVKRYERHMEAVRQKEQAIEAAKQKKEQAEASAKIEIETAIEKARKEEEARQALADAIEYAATVIPDAVRLPEVYLSKKIVERGFVAEIHMPHHSELFKSVKMKDWAEIVRIVSGKIETRKDVNDAVIRLTSYRDEFHYTPEWWNEGGRQSGSTTIELSGESWEVAVEIRSQDLVLDHRLIDMSGQIYLHLLKLPGDPKKLVYMKQDKINVDVPRYTLRSNDAGFDDGIWTCLAANNGFIYRVPLGGSKIFVFEDGVRSMAHEEYVESVWKAVTALNQQKTFGNNDTQELMDKGVQVANRYYQFVAGKLMTQF